MSIATIAIVSVSATIFLDDSKLTFNITRILSSEDSGTTLTKQDYRQVSEKFLISVNPSSAALGLSFEIYFIRLFFQWS